MKEDAVNDYSGLPPEVKVSDKVGRTMGTTTGEEENAIEAGGWQGTDDATSTAPSDLARQDQPEQPLNQSENQDPTGRAYAGGLSTEDGGTVDITGHPVEESRDWELNPVELPKTGTA